MALYQNEACIKPSVHVAFDFVHEPGRPAPFSGIYRCEVCRHEIVSTAGQPLPPQNHAQHPSDSPVRWRMVVYAEHNK
ncbi:hypothetical protein E4K72_07945 [Oxalobacteraceae bacterium OM1]|nr:hypothetical protein E4K72_07945 [Oxalobacteraceae bacterium OM1]